MRSFFFLPCKNPVGGCGVLLTQRQWRHALVVHFIDPPVRSKQLLGQFSHRAVKTGSGRLIWWRSRLCRGHIGCELCCHGGNATHTAPEEGKPAGVSASCRMQQKRRLSATHRTQPTCLCLWNSVTVVTMRTLSVNLSSLGLLDQPALPQALQRGLPDTHGSQSTSRPFDLTLQLTFHQEYL